MTQTIQLPTLDDRYVLVKEWTDLSGDEMSRYGGVAERAADCRLVSAEKPLVFDMVEIALHPTDYEALLDACDGELGRLTVAESWTICTAPVAEGSEIHGHLLDVSCMSPEGSDP